MQSCCRLRVPRTGRILIAAVTAAVTLACVPAAVANSYSEDNMSKALELLASAEIDTLLADADLHLQRQQPDLALRLYRQVPEASPRKLKALLGEGACLFYLGDYEQSARFLRRVVSRADTAAAYQDIRATGLELLAQSYEQLGQFDFAHKVYQQLADIFPERKAYAILMRAKLLFQAGSYRMAFETLRPLLHEERYQPAYDFALDLYWKLDSRDQKKMSQLLQRYLAASAKDYTGRG
jgi:tetratricopeptide (TPR) repeat protein